MASIILSFVGNQDPFSDNTQQEGSIVSLVNHLLANQQTISRVILLHTTTTEPGAEDTKEWLESDANLPGDIIEILAVDEALSNDPVNLLLAAQEARKAIEKATAYLTAADRLEFNSSSGTPAMKSAWNILQAAGYAAHSRVWQVRNPKEIKQGQSRIFQTNVDVLKNEFDIKIIKRQIQDYNYSGALTTLKETNLTSELIIALLQYGHCRISFDFKQAFDEIKKFTKDVDNQLIAQISTLSRKEPKALLKEIYFNALIRLKNQEYSDFLVRVAGFQEGVLKFLVGSIGLETPEKYSQTYKFWQDVQSLDGGKLYQYLENNFVTSDLTGFINRPMMIAIVEYSSRFSDLIKPLKELNEYCGQRNDYIHRFEGVSEIKNAQEIVNILEKILSKIINTSLPNPFDSLNETICLLLDSQLSA